MRDRPPWPERHRAQVVRHGAATGLRRYGGARWQRRPATRPITRKFNSRRSRRRDLRQQMTGISLDEEATILVQFQRAYEATAPDDLRDWIN